MKNYRLLLGKLCRRSEGSPDRPLWSLVIQRRPPIGKWRIVIRARIFRASWDHMASELRMFKFRCQNQVFVLLTIWAEKPWWSYSSLKSSDWTGTRIFLSSSRQDHRIQKRTALLEKTRNFQVKTASLKLAVGYWGFHLDYSFGLENW